MKKQLKTPRKTKPRRQSSFEEEPKEEVVYVPATRAAARATEVALLRQELGQLTNTIAAIQNQQTKRVNIPNKCVRHEDKSNVL
jgi:hypothetical protein